MRNIVPRIPGVNTLGTPAKRWGAIYANQIVLPDNKTLMEVLSGQDTTIEEVLSQQNLTITNRLAAQDAEISNRLGEQDAEIDSRLSAQESTINQLSAQKADKSEVELKANQVDLQALASTSEIVASGNDYIRWVNGLQICWGSLSSESGKISTANFPQAFIDTPIITLSPYNGGASATTSDSRVVTLRTGTNNTTIAWHTTSFTGNSGTSVRYIAIGWWK